jgi:hypothetical protein
VGISGGGNTYEVYVFLSHSVVTHQSVDHKILIAEQTRDSDGLSFQVFQTSDLAVLAHNDLGSVAVTQVADLYRNSLLAKFHG